MRWLSSHWIAAAVETVKGNGRALLCAAVTGTDGLPLVMTVAGVVLVPYTCRAEPSVQRKLNSTLINCAD